MQKRKRIPCFGEKLLGAKRCSEFLLLQNFPSSFFGLFVGPHSTETPISPLTAYFWRKNKLEIFRRKEIWPLLDECFLLPFCLFFLSLFPFLILPKIGFEGREKRRQRMQPQKILSVHINFWLFLPHTHMHKRPRMEIRGRL